MSDDRCPNCSAAGFTGEGPCRTCDWQPLQPTEMLFGDEQQVRCPHCGRARPFDSASCPHCGGHDVLPPLSHRSESFQLSTLLLLITLAAACLAVLRLVPALGIIALVLLAFTTLRTALLVRERKRYRYGVSVTTLADLFLRNCAAVLVAMFIVGGSFVVETVFLNLALEPIFRMSELHGYAVLSLTSIVLSVTAALGTRGKPGRRRATVAGLLMALVLCGALTILALAAGGSVATLLFAPLAGLVFLPTLVLACRRGGVGPAKSLLIGYAVGLSLCGSLLFSLLPPEIAGGVLITSLYLWPILITIWGLEQIWSWDDAFPPVSARRRFSAGPSHSSGPPRQVEPDAGIDFLQDVSERQKP